MAGVVFVSPLSVKWWELLVLSFQLGWVWLASLVCAARSPVYLCVNLHHV